MDSNRGFSPGSRQAPDPFDQYLEREGFYRKHTPRDSSSLFRCVSEQLFDTQQFFRRVRDECCAYMRRNREYFNSHVDGDFDEYLQNMQHFRTRGTLLELRALAYRYRRNVVLFEPYNLGHNFIELPQHGDAASLMIFVSPDYHFDTVYTRGEIEDAAFSQSLVYEVLYKDVFQLADVNYAVERMLHDQLGARLTAIEGTVEEEDGIDENNNNQMEEEEENDEENWEKKSEVNLKVIEVGALTQDGREFVFDGKSSTKCILEDYRMCHFHNDAFAEYLDSLQAAGDAPSNGNSINNPRFNRRREDSLLKVADVSCVRQLLNSGITPFPYKVAKALDADIYRNIEFDVWSDMRKLARSKYMYRRYISVGDKCFVRLNEAKEPVNNNNNKVCDENGDGNKRGQIGKVYVGHVQHIERFTNLCHVYVEELNAPVVVHSSTLRSCYNGHDPRDFSVGFNAANRPGGDKFNRPQFKFRTGGGPGGSYPPSSPGSQLPFGPQRSFLRNGQNNNFPRSTFYRHSPYHNHQQQFNNFQNHPSRQNKRFIFSNNNKSIANSDSEEDISLLKKKASLITNTDDQEDHYHGELQEKDKAVDIYDSQQAQHVNLKELLCSTYYYAESAKFFQCQDIIALPAFITTTKKLGDDDENHDRQNNNENLKRNNQVGGGGEKNSDFENKSQNENQDAGGGGGEGDEVMEGGGDVGEDEQELHLPYDHHQYHQQVVTVSDALVTGGDPSSVIYSGIPVNGGQQQYYANAAATGGAAPGATYYLPATTMDAAYYQPYYRNGVATSQPTAAATPYYCNYVYSNGATGGSTMQTMTPYLLATNGGQFDGGQMIPIQTAIRRRDLLCSETPVNLNAAMSYSTKGNDLPLNDLSSLRFYYNLGVQCFGYMASMQGAQNALNSLQFGGGGGGIENNQEENSTSATPPIINSKVDAMNQELRSLAIEASNKEVETPTAITSTSATAAATTISSSSLSSGGNYSSSSSVVPAGGRNFQGPGYRRPPFNNNPNNNMRGGYGGRSHHQYNSNNNNYRSGGGMQQQQQNQQQGGGNVSGDNKGKDNRSGQGGGGGYNYYNNYGSYAYNRRNGGGGPNVGGRFNNGHYNNNNNNLNNHRNNNNNSKPPQNNVPTGGGVGAEGNRSHNAINNNPEEKINSQSQQQSPFQGTTNAGNSISTQRHGQSPSPATGGSKGGQYNNDMQYSGQQQVLHGQQQQEENTNSQLMYGGGIITEGTANQMPTTIPVNYFGAPAAAGQQQQQFTFSGPPPHLPPPFGGSAQQPQMMGIAAQAPVAPQIYNSPFYTTYAAYYPVDMMGGGGGQAAATGMIPGGDNMIIQSMPYVTAAAPPPGSPYAQQSLPPNQHLMGAGGGNNPQQVATPPNPATTMYYAAATAGGEPGTPIMQSWAGTAAPGMMGEGMIPWSSSTGGTPVNNNGNSVPSSGIGSTESSPPYGGGQQQGGGGGVIYANQSPGYNYSYPPPQQQQFWYAASQQQPQMPVVGQGTVAATVTGGGGGGGGSGTPVPAVKGEMKP